MTDFKKGLIGVLGTIVVVMIEFILFPIALVFMVGMNSTGSCNATGGSCTGEFISASDQAILANAPTLMIVIILFTLIGGLVASVFIAIKG